MTRGDLVATLELPADAGRIAWSPDGRWIAACPGAPWSPWGLRPGDGGTMAVVDVETGGLRWQADEWSAWTIAFSPDGRWLAVTSEMGNAYRTRMLNAETGAEIWQLAGASRQVAVFSPDSRWLVISDIEQGRLVEAESGGVHRDLGPCSFLLVPAFSSDSRWLATAATERAMVIDTRTGEEQWVVPITSEVRGFAFAAGDRSVVAVCEGTVLVLDAETGVAHTSAEVGGGIPFGADAIFALSPDRQVLAKVGGIAQFRVGAYQVADGRRLFSRPISSSQPRVAFSPRVGVIAVNSAGDTGVGVMLLRAETGETVGQVQLQSAADLAFSPDGRRLAVVGGRHIHVYQASTEGLVWQSFPHEGPVAGIVVTAGDSPAQMRVVATVSGPAPGSGGDARAMVFHADSGALLWEREHSNRVLTAIACSPDGEFFSIGAGDGSVFLYALSGRRLWWFRRADAVSMLAFTPDGQAIAIACNDRTARLIRRDPSADGQPVELWSNRHPKAVTLVAVSPDGRWVATGCATTTRILDASNGEVPSGFEFPHAGRVRSLAFGPPGSVLAAGSADGVLLIDPATGEERGHVGHDYPVTAVAVSPDGALLASGDSRNHVRITDLAGLPDGQPLVQLTYAAPVSRLAFNPVDRSLAVVTEDAIVRVIQPDDGNETGRLTHLATVNDIAYSPDGELLATACDDANARLYLSR